MSRNTIRLVAVFCVASFIIAASPGPAPTGGEPFGQMILELEEPGTCQSSDMVCVELWMRNIENTNATGFNAFVTYDETLLIFNCKESYYTDDPFPLHIPGDICDAIGDPPHPGQLDLSSSDVLGGKGTNQDALLARLCFDVLAECGVSSIGFTHNPPFFTELSFEGDPIPTGLRSTPLFTNDETAPSITLCPPNVEIDCLASTDPDNTGYPVAFDNCDGPISQEDISWSDASGVSDCCVNNGTPGCDDPTCEGIVCDIDPFCCDTSWDDICADEACDLCDPALCPGCGNEDCEIVITRTFSVPDSCGNVATCVQVITQVDTQPPVLGFIEPVIQLDPPNAGQCCRPLSPQNVTATDDCTEFPEITCQRDDGADCSESLLYCADTADFPGDTVYFNTWKATDACGNMDVFVQEVRIPAYNVLNLDLELEGVGDPFPPPKGECERCVHFETDDCSGFDVPLVFTDPANGNFYTFDGAIAMPCGDWDTLCIKEPHTLWETRTLTIANQEYHLEQALLLCGDTDNNGIVDIHDVTWWVVQGQPPQIIPPFSCPWNGDKDADFNCDGVITFLPDYTCMASHWMAVTACPGCPAPNSADPGDSFAFAISTEEVPDEVAETVDANRDGRIDYKDVRIFEDEMGYPHLLSDLIEITQFVFDPPADAP